MSEDGLGAIAALRLAGARVRGAFVDPVLPSDVSLLNDLSRLGRLPSRDAATTAITITIRHNIHLNDQVTTASFAR